MYRIIKHTIFLIALITVNSMVYSQEPENKRGIIFLERNIFPQAYMQNDMPMVPLESILNVKYPHTFFAYSYEKDGDKIILQNTSGVDIRTTTYLEKDEIIPINLATNQYVIKNKTYHFSRPPQIIDGNTYVPADFFLKAFGYPIAVDRHSVYIGHSDVQNVTPTDMTLFVERKNNFIITLELTLEEWEKGMSDVWKFEIKPTKGISLIETMPVERRVIGHSWSEHGNSAYETNIYNKPQYAYEFKTLTKGKYEIKVSNGITSFNYIIVVL